MQHIQNSAAFPDYVKLGMVCMILSHRINRTRSEPHARELSESFLLYRGDALRSLNLDLSLERNQTSDYVFVGIITLLLNDVSSGSLDRRITIPTKDARSNKESHPTGDIILVELRE
jgi:hypothetical protein